MFKKIILALSVFATMLTACSDANPTSGNTEIFNTDPNAPIQKMKSNDVTALSFFLISYDLADIGYETHEAIVTVGEKNYYGIAYTNYETVYQDADGNSYYGGGFYQIVSDESVTDSYITQEEVDQGLLAVTIDEREDEESQNETYLIDRTALEFKSYSYIMDGWYSYYEQIGDYVLKINTFENDRKYYRTDIDCYSFDTNKWVFKSDESMKGGSLTGSNLYSDYAIAYREAVLAVQEILELQEQNAHMTERITLVVVSGDLISNEFINMQEATINGTRLVDLIAAHEQIAENQSLVITPDGVEIVYDNKEVLLGKRIVNGIFGVIGSLLLIAGSVAVIVQTWGTATPIAVFGIITAVNGFNLATVNLISSISDIIYGSQGDLESEAINIFKLAIEGITGSEEAASIAYNIWQIATTISMMIAGPIASAYKIGNTFKLSISQTVGHALRGIAFTAVSGLIVTAVTLATTYFTTELVLSLTGNEVLAYAVGLTAGLIAAAVTSLGIAKLDAQYNISGLNKGTYAKYIKEGRKNPNFEKLSDQARSSAGRKLKEEWLDDIMTGEDYHTLNPDDPHDAKIINYVQKNGKFPSDCHFAHAVNVAEIKNAYYSGLISMDDAINFISNPKNGILTSRYNHQNIYHGGKWTNSTDYESMFTVRPEIKDFVLNIIQAIGG